MSDSLIREIQEIRKLQLTKRELVNKREREMQEEAKELNRILLEIERVRNEWKRAVEKYDATLTREENEKKMSPNELKLYDSNYLSVPFVIDEKFIDDITKEYGLIPVLKKSSDDKFYTGLYFNNEDIDKEQDDELRFASFRDKSDYKNDFSLKVKPDTKTIIDSSKDIKPETMYNDKAVNDVCEIISKAILNNIFN